MWAGCMSESGIENGNRCAIHLPFAEKDHSIQEDSSKETISRSERKKPFPLFHPAMASLSSKSHKTLAIWSYFAHFDPAFHPNKKDFQICLTCHGNGIHKQLNVGIKASTAPLESHLAMHPEENQKYITLKVEAATREANAKTVASKGQMTLTKHFPPVDAIKAKFQVKFSKWVVNECLPLNEGESDCFKEMIQVANAKIIVPD